MIQRGCRHEEEVRHAALTGRWTTARSSHAAVCGSCGEVQLVVGALRHQPDLTHPARQSIDPSALWACGRHARRIGTEARIAVVVAAVQIGVLCGVLAIVLSFVDWRTVWTVVAGVRLSGEAWLLSALGACAVAVVAITGWLSSVDRQT